MGKVDEYNYGVVLDAGSSGTRIYIYRWDKNSIARTQPDTAYRLPELESKDKWTKKVHPGISTFGDTPELVGPDHLDALIKHALDYIPKEAVPNTPIFLLATAGMRLLPDAQRYNVLHNVCSYLLRETEFYLPDCGVHIQVISGETEGLYGWIAANYLLGGFDEPQNHNHGKGHHTYGFLDLGGASAQIAFAPNATEAQKHGNDLTLLRLRTVDGHLQEYKVFVATWLGFGVNQARKKFVNSLLDAYAADGILELPDPCLPNGLRMDLDAKVLSATEASQLTTQHLLGTGRFDECLKQTFPLLEKDKPCLDTPCLINGQHVPAIDFDVNHFVGVSEYWHTTHEIFGQAHKDKSYDFTTYQKSVSEFCSQDWSIIEADVNDQLYGKKVDAATAYEVCFKASWLINILHDGIGVPRFDVEGTGSGYNSTKDIVESGKEKSYLDPFQAVNKINSREVSWTLGKMVLYASADVPPALPNDLPVGFGSNVAGVPDDFQLPGGGLLQPDSKDVPTTSITGKIKDTLFQTDSPHRVPGFLFFLLMIFIAIFYLRRRRNNTSGIVTNTTLARTSSPILRTINRFLGRPNKFISSYDRALEDGQQRLFDPDDFELGAMDSDEDEGALGSDGVKAFGSPNGRRVKNTSAGRLTPPHLMDRAGVLLRTESRERFDTIGRKSRNGSLSPTRQR